MSDANHCYQCAVIDVLRSVGRIADPHFLAMRFRHLASSVNQQHLPKKGWLGNVQRDIVS